MAEPFNPYHKWLGIPLKDQPPNHYRLLGIDPFEPDPDVIAHAADARMVHLKTLQAGKHSALSQRILNEIAAAKVCLLNPAKKAAYDEQLRGLLGARPPVIAQAAVAVPMASPPPASPQPVAAPVPQFASPSAPSYAAGRRRQSWQVPVLLAGLAAVAVAVAALSVVGDGQPDVAQRPAADKTAPPTPREQRPGTAPEVRQPRHPAEADLPKTEEDPAAGGEPPATSPGETPADKPPTENEAPAVPDVPSTPAEKPEEHGSPEEPGIETPEMPMASGPAVEKLAVPEIALQQEAEQRIREIFRTDFAATGNSETRLALAEKLLEQGRETHDDPTARYVLLWLAATLAAEAGELPTAFEAVDRIAAEYQAAAPALKADALQKAVESGVGGEESARGTVAAARTVAEEAVDAEDFPTATRVARMAVAAARKTRDAAVVREITAWSRETERLEQRFEQLRTDLELLAGNPDDPDANLAVGQWYALVVGRWEQGLPHLVKGSDAVLAELARRDLAAPAEAGARAELAGQWWELADKQDGGTRMAMMSRAAHWYEQALPDLTGLTRTQAEKRLDEYAALEANKGTSGKKKGKYALAFDGQKSHILVPKFPYDGTSPLTVEATVIPASVDRSATIVGNLGDGGWGLGVFDLGRFGVQERHWAFFFRTEGGLGGPAGRGWGRFPMGTGSNTPAAVNRRVTLAAVYDGQQLRFYVDGQQQFLAPPVRGRHRPGPQLLVIGGAPGNADVPADLFHGTIEQVRVSLVSRYAASYTPQPRLEKDKFTQLLLDLDEGEGTVAHDSSGRNRHGKIVDAEWVKRQ